MEPKNCRAVMLSLQGWAPVRTESFWLPHHWSLHLAVGEYIFSGYFFELQNTSEIYIQYLYLVDKETKNLENVSEESWIKPPWITRWDPKTSIATSNPSQWEKCQFIAPVTIADGAGSKRSYMGLHRGEIHGPFICQAWWFFSWLQYWWCLS